MKRYCVKCGLLSSEHDIWCQDRACAVGEASYILRYGDQLSGIKIIRLLFLLRTAAIYEAERSDQRIILKVAHVGCEDQLQKEAEKLVELQQYPPYRFVQRWRRRLGLRHLHPALPILLPAYQESPIKQYPFGRAVFHDQEKYFEVFQYDEKFYFGGKLLKDWLSDDSQPWYKNAVWLVLGIADAIGYLNFKAKTIHANLNTDMILVHLDKKGVFRPLLLDLGKLVDEVSIKDIEWLHRFAAPNYLAPELTYLRRRDPDHSIFKVDPPLLQTDVYGLGVLLYEMVKGHSAFQIKRFNQKEEITRKQVITNKPEDVFRNDLIEPDMKGVGINRVLQKALSKNPQERFPNAKAFAETLRHHFGGIPRPRRTFGQWSRITFLMFVTLVLLISLVIIFAAPTS